MPAQVVLPPPAILWDTIMMWPPKQGASNASTTADSLDVSTGHGPIQEGVTPKVFSGLGTGGTLGFQEHPTLLINGFRMTYAGPGGVPSFLQFGCMHLPVTALAATDLAPGCVLPESRRFTWLRCYFDIRGGNPTDQTGLVMSNAFQIGITYWFGSAVAPLWGIIGDGAGGLQWRSQNAAGAILETVAIPGGIFVPDRINCLEWLVLNGAAGRNASVVLRLNGQQIISRNWVTPPALARMGAGASAGGYPQPGLRIFDAGLQFWVFALDYRSGPFTDQGVPVQS